VLSFAVTIFLGAFLLFQVQPLVGKVILPRFGSSPGVWTTCLLFFQVLLLGGYVYAHLLVRRLSARTQALTHIALLAGAVALLPIEPSDTWAADSGDDPIWPILLLLATSVGLPFLALSATSPLLQAWLARMRPGRSPYRYYALGNAGSILALVTYPLVLEPHLGLGDQTTAWSVAFGAFALGCAWCATRGMRSPALETVVDAGPVTRPPLVDVILWLSLSACGSGLLMATTNRLCTDVAVIPFLWVLPLGLYLLTFVICFDHDRWYVRPLFCALLPAAMAAAGRSLHLGVDHEISTQVALGSGVLFVCLMCCHGELARLRPHARHLTAFYLAIALGGALGGLFVAIVAPVVFTGIWEYHLLLLACYVLVLFAAIRSLPPQSEPVRRSLARRILSHLAWLPLVAMILGLTILYLDPWQWADPDLDLRDEGKLDDLITLSRAAACGIVILSALVGMTTWLRRIRRRPDLPRPWQRHVLPGIAILGLVPLLGVLGWHLVVGRDRLIERRRNFYGVLRIEEYVHEDLTDLTLFHGRIMHGFQYQNPGLSDWPTTYYGPWSGLGLAIRRHPCRKEPGRPFRIGVVGLGAGTAAAYANADVVPVAGSLPYVRPNSRSPGDHIVFYEINPLVEEWSRRFFSYRADAESRGATVETRLGDARIVMERQIARGELQRFDVLAIDAFNSDAVPIHLLTNECFRVYAEHLAEDGILAYHVTNKHLDLAPVVHRLARHNGWTSAHVEDDEDEARGINCSDWVLVTRNEEFLEMEVVPYRVDEPIACPLWTDDFSSIWPLVEILPADD
jgi:hypothetical protein